MSKEDVSVLFDFLGRSQILEILEVKAIAEEQSGFLDVTFQVKSTVNDVPCFQQVSCVISKKAVDAIAKMASVKKS